MIELEHLVLFLFSGEERFILTHKPGHFPKHWHELAYSVNAKGLRHSDCKKTQDSSSFYLKSDKTWEKASGEDGWGVWGNGGVGGESVFSWQLTAAAIFLALSGWLEGGAGAATQSTP